MSENQRAGTSLGGGGITPALKESLRKYEKLCADMEALAADPSVTDHAERGKALASEFASLPPLPEEFSELLSRRFSEASRAVERAAEGDDARRKEAEKLRSELQAVKDAGELATLRELTALKTRWNAFFGPENAEWQTEAGELEAALEKEEAEKTRRNEEAEKLASELEALVAAGDPDALKERRSAIESAYASLGSVSKPHSTRYQEALRNAQTMLARHFETLDYARWESYTLKLDLLAELEKLQNAPENELGDASRKLVAIRDKWKALGSVPKEKSEEVNPRYLELTRTLQHRVDEYFSNRRQEQKNAAAEKEKLCEEAEKNASRTDWGPGSAAFRELQAKWKALPRSGAREQELFSRFRTAADKFFTARNEVFAERDRKFAQAAAAKRKLIEEIASMTDVRRAKNLRSEYNALGSAGREENELYKAFNAALDKFFADRSAAFAEKDREASALITELEALAANSPLEGSARAREIRRRFDELNCRRLAGAMEKAESKYASARREAERAAQCERWTAYLEAAKRASELLETPDEPIPEAVAAFPKLVSSLEAARAGSADEKAAKQWEKLLAHNEKECARIVAEAEALSGKEKKAEATDLAAELQAAIMGNFARRESEARRSAATPETLRREFMALGALPMKTLVPALELLAGL